MRAPRSWFGDATLLAFALAQLCDGVFTYVGVRVFGASIEANPIVAWYIDTLGASAAMVAVKGLALTCGAFLHIYGRHRTLALLAALYVVVAIRPWLDVLQLVP
jgi:arginine exporter protein ArgO